MRKNVKSQLEETAQACVKSIMVELRGRAGFRELWDSLQPGIRNELQEALVLICRVALEDVQRCRSKQKSKTTKASQHSQHPTRAYLAPSAIPKELLLRRPSAFQPHTGEKSARHGCG
jgi:hypothetical protein